MSGFGVYIHWPYCRSKCPYCDFASTPAKNFDFDVWQKAYRAALEKYAARTAGKTVSSIFFGGGTPSLMTPELVSSVIETILTLWPAVQDVEISLEANPCSLNEEKMRALHGAGVNRLSIGVQTLNDKDLKFLGRLHSAEQALETVSKAKEIFPRVSADFIYGRPHQTLKDWENELAQILELNLSHLSLYQLTLEEGTYFYKKGIELPEEELAADMFELTDRMTYRADVPRYEVSNHAAAGQECRHNLLYWNGGEWLGIGPAAHGRFTQDGLFYASAQERSAAAWLDGAEPEEIVLTPKEKAEELIFMGLRTACGIDRKAFKEVMSEEPETFMHPGTLQDYQMDGFIVCDEKGLRATGKGLLILNALCRSLLI